MHLHIKKKLVNTLKFWKLIIFVSVILEVKMN